MAPAGAQTGALRTDLLEIPEPQLRVVVAGIIFGEGDLDPAIGADLPGASRWLRPVRDFAVPAGSSADVAAIEPSCSRSRRLIVDM